MNRAGWRRTSLAGGATDPWRIVSPENYRGIISNWQDDEIGVWCKWSSPAEYASVTRMLTNTLDYTDISAVYLIRAIAPRLVSYIYVLYALHLWGITISAIKVNARAIGVISCIRKMHEYTRLLRRLQLAFE